MWNQKHETAMASFFNDVDLMPMIVSATDLGMFQREMYLVLFADGTWQTSARLNAVVDDSLVFSLPVIGIDPLKWEQYDYAEKIQECSLDIEDIIRELKERLVWIKRRIEAA